MCMEREEQHNYESCVCVYVCVRRKICSPSMCWGEESQRVCVCVCVCVRV